ncbi:MAG: hypothetical protein KAY37_15555, partial [Phycisphaerae bacterium]|nr:hypothetical protein [Phycisphaerae bacterium]
MLVRKTMAQTVVTLVPVMWMAGCGSGFILPAQPELPASLDWLLEHQEEFWFAELQQPPAVDGAAGVDFADQLSGCWGMARPAGGEIPVPHWQAYKFDSHKKEFVLWIMEDPFGLRLFQIVILESGTYEVVQEGDTPAIRFVTTECWVSNPETGQLVEEHLFEGPEVGETPAVLDAGSLYLEVGGSADSVWWQGWIGVAACLAVAAVAWVATDMLICKDQQKTRDHNALIEASSAEFVG